MPDITMCHGTNCPHAKRCYRARAVPSEYWQSYFTEVPWDGENCSYFMKIEGRRVAESDDSDDSDGWGDRPSVPESTPTIPPRRRPAGPVRSGRAGRIAENATYAFLLAIAMTAVIGGLWIMVGAFSE